MKILAIMQNQWFRDPEAVKRIMAKRPTWRRQLIARFLFAGCKSGRALKQAFGSSIEDIVWEEASPEIGGESSSSFPADPKHLQEVLDDVQPDVVLAFGRIAERGLDGLVPVEKLIVGPHPAARHPKVPMLLRSMALQLERRRVTTAPRAEEGTPE